MHRRPFALHLLLAAIGLAAGSDLTKALAHGTLPRDTPIERLVKNLDARLAKRPDDADLHYMLGRLHALAFETGNEDVPIWQSIRHRREEDPGEDWDVLLSKYWVRVAHSNDVEPRKPTDDEMHVHLREAVIHLNRAIELAPAVAAYRLALASILESGEPMAHEIEVSPLCPVRGVDVKAISQTVTEALEKFDSDSGYRGRIESYLRVPGFGLREPGLREEVVTELDRERRHENPIRRAVVRELLRMDWSEQITQQYFAAVALAVPKEGSTGTQPIMGWGSREAYVSYEAANAYVRIVTARGVKSEDAVRLAVAKATIAALDGLPVNRAITPILFSLADTRPLRDLLDSGATTTFDLDGSGLAQRWPWVARDTGILVWDPLKSGRITSGRQLFGSVSWWLFFKNGYDALAALDDDGDGELSGRELDGLAVWFDRNGNGQSDLGEVVPVDELGIAGLSCRATEMTEDSPCNPRGLRLSTGAILPTYDWIARPLPKAPAVSGAPGTAAPRSGA